MFLKNKTVLENSLNFEISTFVLEKYLNFVKTQRNAFVQAKIQGYLQIFKEFLTIYPAFCIFFTKNVKSN